MLELLRLVVHLVPPVAHDPDQEQFDDPVPPDDQRGKFLPGVR